MAIFNLPLVKLFMTDWLRPSYIFPDLLAG